MANIVNPVPPLNPWTPYFDAQTGKLTAEGFNHFSTLQAQVGVIPARDVAPTSQSATAGSAIFVPSTHTLYIYDGTVWRSVVLA